MTNLTHIPSILEQEAVINQSWTDWRGICNLVPISCTAARRIINQITDEMHAEGSPTFISQRKLVPVARIVKKLGINTTMIRNEAARIRSAERNDK